MNHVPRPSRLSFLVPTVLALVITIPARAVDADDDKPTPHPATVPTVPAAGATDDDRKPATKPAPPATGATDDDDKPTGKSASPKVDRTTLAPEILAAYQVTVGAVGRRPLTAPVQANGSIALDPTTIAQVGTLVPGRITEILVQVGTAVHAGDPLLAIDSPDLGQAQNDWIQRHAALVVAQTAVDVTEKTWTRTQSLIADHTVSGAEAERREGEWKKATADLVAATAGLQAAVNTLHLMGFDDAACADLARNGAASTRVFIRAPRTGTIMTQNAVLGAIARPDQDALLTIADPTSLIVIANIPDVLAAQVRVGQAVRVTASALSQPLTTTVAGVGLQVDPETRTLAVRCALPGGTDLKPGMFTSVAIDTAPAQAPTLLMVPQEAVFIHEGFTVVFVAESASTFAARHLVVGPSVGGFVPVLTGLAEGDRIVVSGGFIIAAELGKGTGDDD